MLAQLVRRFTEAAQDAASEAPKIVRKGLPGVGRIILTASAKGGVGKSTVALNTATALQKLGYKVGIFDANIYGPSIARMAGTKDILLVPDQEANYKPAEKDGIYSVSVANVIDEESSLHWKAPYLGAILGDFMKKAAWPELDYLIVDTPADTGDVPLSLCTIFIVDGAVVVTTPDELSSVATGRTIDMLKRMPIDIIGVIQNMDGVKCPDCKKVHKVLNGDAANHLASAFNIENLGSAPLDPEVVEACSTGVPEVIKNPNSDFSKLMKKVAETIVKKVPKQTPAEPARTFENPLPEPSKI